MNTSRRRLRLISLVVFVAFTALSGCASRRPPIPGTPLSLGQRQTIHALITKRSTEISSLRSLSRVEIQEQGERSVVRGAIVFKHPSQFRLELLPLTSVYTLQLLVANKHEAILLIPGEHEAIVSSSASGLLQSALKLPLSEGDLMFYFVGRVPPRFAALVADENETLVSSDLDSGLIHVHVKSTGDLWAFNATSGLLHSAKLLDRFDRASHVELSYAGTFDTTAPPISQQVRVALPAQALSLTFDVLSAKVNEEVPESLFAVTVPSSYRVTRRR